MRPHQRKPAEPGQTERPREPEPLPAGLDPIVALQRSAGNQAVARMLQRKLAFSDKVTYLDTDAKGSGPFPGVFTDVQKRAKALPMSIDVDEGQTEGERAHYAYDYKNDKASIQVAPRRYAGRGDSTEDLERNGIMIAMVHETQHALDDLESTSELKGAVADRGKPKPQDALISSVFERMMSELHAHAVQAGQARELQKAKQPVPQADHLLAQSFELKEFEPGGAMFKKLVLYAKLYTGGTNEESLARQVMEMLYLNWGEVEDLVALSHKDPGKIGIEHPGRKKAQESSEEESVEEIIVGS